MRVWTPGGGQGAGPGDTGSGAGRWAVPARGRGQGGRGADLRDRGGAGWVGGVRAGEVGEDGAKHGWVLDGGDDAEAAATAGAGEDIEIPHAAHQSGDSQH